MPIENYSHMVMENKHMVDGDSVSDYGGDESLRILFSRVKKRINQPPKNKDHGGGSALVHEKLCPLGG
jgi:hypothetical protein